MPSTASDFTEAWPFATNAKESGRSGLMPSCSASRRPSAICIGTKRKYPRRSRLLTKPQPREHRTHTPSNRIRPCGESTPPGLFRSTTIDCFACMEKGNTTASREDFTTKSMPGWAHKRKRPDNRGAPKLHPVRCSGGELGRLDLQDFAGTRDRDRPGLHCLWDLAHEVDVQEPIL